MSAAAGRAVRGAILTALPDGGVHFTRDGVLVFDEAGRLRHAGPSAARHAAASLVAGHRDDLIAAAPWDPHVHLPQLPIAGRHGEPLLEWLRRRALPAEKRHADLAHASRETTRFFDALDRAGTVGAGIFTAPFPRAARRALEVARARGVPARIGPPLMDTGDTGLERSAERWLGALDRLIEAHGRAAAVVPRFGLSCTLPLLREAGRLARARRAWVLGHVSETREEVDGVRTAHGTGYVELYERSRLLGPRSLLAHGIHLTNDECAALAASRAWIVHCPTSNDALGSGRMPLERLRRHGVRVCLGTDVGAGRSLCMLDVMARFLTLHRGRAKTAPAEAFRLGTLAGATALGFGATRGALARGRAADFLLVPGGAKGVRSAAGAIRALIERYEARPGHAAPGTLWRAGAPAGTEAQ